jgi:hypothetical protein
VAVKPTAAAQPKRRALPPPRHHTTSRALRKHDHHASRTSGGNTSAIMPVPDVMNAATPAPCSARNSTSTAALGANVQPSEAPMKATQATTYVGRRPKRSLAGPQTSAAMPTTNM